MIGEYDIVIDANQNRVYDAPTDGLDGGSPGFVVIATPSVPVPALAPIEIIALIGLLCVIGVSGIRRRFTDAQERLFTHAMTKGGWRYCKMPKTTEVMYDKGMFKPIQRVNLPDKVKLRRLS